MDRWERAVSYIADRSSGDPIDPSLQLTLNFHPDRIVRGRIVVESIATSGRYTSQFESQISNGGLTVFPGGARWLWESRLFGQCYDDAPDSERPLYGALDTGKRPTGAAPRSGSAHIRLAQHILPRSTFCFPDSAFEPVHFGVSTRMSSLQTRAADAGEDLDDLDNYIEAHVHGGIAIEQDVEALVLDPSFRGTDVERSARKLRCDIEWHDGFSLTVDERYRHPDYWGIAVDMLGALLAVDGCLTPRVVGDAFRSGVHNPDGLKKVWHCLARFGGPQ